MKISYNWLKNISLVFILLFIPFSYVKASFCDPLPDIMVISAVLMISVAAIIFMHIFAEKKELLIKVLTFCGFLSLFFLFLIPIINTFVFVIIIAAIIMNLFARKKRFIVKMIIFIISLILLFFTLYHFYPLGFYPTDVVILFGIFIIIVYLKIPKERKAVLNKIMFLFVILFLIFCYNENRIRDIYTIAKCEILGGEIVEDYCNLRCDL